MANYSAKNVDEYVQGTPEVAHPHIEAVRKAVRAAAPEAEETISYGKPYYKYPKHLVGFDVYPQHMTFEIYGGQLEDDHRAKLEEKGYKTGSKSFRIRYDQVVPVEMLRKIVMTQVDRRAV